MVNIASLWQYLALQAPLHSSMSGEPLNLTKMGLTTYTLPALPYAYNALEPHISAQIMELHHSKHHQAYVTNLNKALESHVAAVAAGDVAAQIALQQTIKFNGGGHINHSLFWKNLAPAGTEETRADAAKGLVAEIDRTWGGLENFKKTFSAALLGIQGSGWGWLVQEGGHGGSLRIVTTKDQDPVVGGDVPILGVDMWEHAYYLQYLNGKAAYVENIWNVINWKTAEERFQGKSEDKLEEKSEL
ncbi:Superoxide dismutase [Mn], mitochondrial [Staphylotrichum longicolle]|uniref:Superoxide dismutase n=1 Tax=Staphylotrichum longicolle TaxID=669026 RepID=A0AAD4EY18_9PEZI|nr:Superoxide dismutase [Mn], mitochondrial [Staphylotrichum longicolle]